MCKPVGKYPGFEKIEIVAELEKPAQRTLTFKDTAGNNARFRKFTSPALPASSLVLTRKLSENLLVVSFYSKAWLTYSLEYLREVNQLQYVFGAMGAQLIVLEPNSLQVESALNISDYGMNLHFYFNPVDLVSNGLKIFPKDFCDPDINFGERSEIARLACNIIDGFYKVAFAHVGILNNSRILHPVLQYA